MLKRNAMRYKYLKTIVLLLFCCVSATVFSQSGTPTITSTISSYDSLLLLAKRGLATMKDYDLLQTYHTKIWQEYQKTLDINEKWAYDDSVVRRQNFLLKEQMNQKDNTIVSQGAMIDTLRMKKNKSFSLGISTGYDPISRRVFIGPSLNVAIVKFSLKGAFTGSTPATPTGGTLSDRLRSGN